MRDGKQISATILEQLGGNRFLAMTGAKNMSYDKEGSLMFGLPRFSGVKVNHVKISLNARDTYDIEFGQIWGMKYKIIAKKEDIYNDQLQEVFRTVTGLETRMPKIIFK